MAFDPISWMVSFSVGRVAGRVLKTSKDSQLARNLRQALKDWAKKNQPPVHADALETMFSPEDEEAGPERFAARRRLSQTILNKQMPSVDWIRDAFLERWDEIRHGRHAKDLQDFFQLPRDEAANQLNGLADRFRRVLQEDQPLFQVTTLQLLEDLKEQVRAIKAGREDVEDDLPIFTVPYPRHTCFKGREDILVDLRQSLVGEKKAALTQVIRGLGGIGKTQTAVEYAYEHREEYQAVLWVKAGTELEIRQDMAEAARLLKLPHDETNLEDAARALKHWLEQSPDWLLIFDNADHPDLLKPFMPRTSEGHVLLTSRASVFDALGILEPIELPLLSDKAAAEFLLERTGRDGSDGAEVESARELANKLGLLPLALEQAGAYIIRKEVSFAEYLSDYRKLRLELLEEKGPVLGTLRDEHALTVAVTWQNNFQEVDAESKAAADLLRLSAFLASDIPYELILRGASASNCHLGKTLSSSENRRDLRDVLEPLTRFSLITIDRKKESYSIHRLVQEAVKHDLGEDGRRIWTERAVGMVNEAFPSGEFETWNLCGRLIAHAVVLAQHAEAFCIHSLAAANLAHQAACFLDDQAQYDGAEPLYKQAMEIWRTALGERHPHFATGLNNLATLYRDMGRYAEAEPFYKQALEIRRTALGEQHPDFATGLNNLASIYQDMGRHDEAKALYKQALEIWRTVLGEQHPLFATSLNNLADLYREIGRHDEAEPLYKKALEIRRTVLGEQHPSFATSLNNLAELYRVMGRHAEAEPLCEQALEIWRIALGEQHPTFAASLNNLALLYQAMGRHAEAEPLYIQALGIKRSALGEQHPDFATSLNNLASLYKDMGRNA